MSPALELSVTGALDEIASSIPRLLLGAAAAAEATESTSVLREWEPSAGTYTYVTSAVIRDAASVELDALSDVFLLAYRLAAQPWLPAYLGGTCSPVEAPLPASVRRAVAGQARFDVGMRRARYYDQVMAELAIDDDTRIIGMRSVAGLPVLPGCVKCYTLTPSADVFQRREGRLYVHHFITTPGASLLPPGADRVLMNALRFLGLDAPERRAYAGEATLLQQFCGSDALAEARRQVRS